MTRALRSLLATIAEEQIRSGRRNVSRERAAVIAEDMLLFAVDDDLRAEVLERFAPAEPPAVAGLDFLAVEQDAKVIVAESLDGPTDWSQHGECPTCGVTSGPCEFVSITNLLGTPRLTPHDERPLTEVKPEPAPAVWDDSVPPGGFVCAVCRTPVESEPCPVHGEVVEGEVTSPFGPCSGLAADKRNNTCENFAAEFVEWDDDLYGTQLRRLCTPCADLLRNVVSREPLTHGPGGVPVERATSTTGEAVA